MRCGVSARRWVVGCGMTVISITPTEPASARDASHLTGSPASSLLASRRSVVRLPREYRPCTRPFPPTPSPVVPEHPHVCSEALSEYDNQVYTPRSARPCTRRTCGFFAVRDMLSSIDSDPLSTPCQGCATRRDTLACALAATNPVSKGWGWAGVDASCGTNKLPTKKGWVGSSRRRGSPS